MNIKKLYDMQRELDRHIEGQHGLDKEDLFDRKLLALLVEAGELANETRCFKFWSVKSASEKQIILEEYVDGIHFILSLGLDLGYEYSSEGHKGEPGDHNLTVQFLKVAESIIKFRSTKSKDDYEALFSQYILLGGQLHFSWQEIEEGYIMKNEVNYERQRQGY
ncbi:dUTP diphosphatase [Mesobacillus harenae]|uniref:dUTP diphosphatase n=1 Tax=Mesobacillus harenae TaxID=2213203 RepID=UPI0015808ED4|nr:dUTP diphosphatase [Mesobacillus harenae]